MKLDSLRQLLAYSLHRDGVNSIAANQEILDQVLAGPRMGEATERKVTAYEINGTTVFLSDAGLSQPKVIIFVDLKSGKSCLLDAEAA